MDLGDISTEMWSAELPDLNDWRLENQKVPLSEHLACTVFQDHILVVAGNLVSKYDGQWHKLPPAPFKSVIRLCATSKDVFAFNSDPEVWQMHAGSWELCPKA